MHNTLTSPPNHRVIIAQLCQFFKTERIRKVESVIEQSNGCILVGHEIVQWSRLKLRYRVLNQQHETFSNQSGYKMLKTKSCVLPRLVLVFPVGWLHCKLPSNEVRASIFAHSSITRNRFATALRVFPHFINETRANRYRRTQKYR